MEHRHISAGGERETSPHTVKNVELSPWVINVLRNYFFEEQELAVSHDGAFLMTQHIASPRTGLLGWNEESGHDPFVAHYVFMAKRLCILIWYNRLLQR